MRTFAMASILLTALVLAMMCARPDPDGCADRQAQRGVETGAQFPGRYQRPCGAHVQLPGHHYRRADRARVAPAGGEPRQALAWLRELIKFQRAACGPGGLWGGKRAFACTSLSPIGGCLKT